MREREKAYIADFYCHCTRLVIEPDGSQHDDDEGLPYDEKRTQVLEQQGLCVLRFSNRDVDEGLCVH